ncbi:transcriptional regulator [Thermoanaerobacter mathranii subsp. mathranii str. A3]|uniref:Transcriptional regulator n=1 Tax=Thermoanaerobacter mathranii subsp. mathranii (strain DSM 11426 / CCUG 53645 / CIP 108742 / A3) TaxID=583358 RepID=A0ABM5LME2_THEM3|nr:hypothetical protein [Thermoanaerobacter mathranii]ADH59855.1 transcriptional regulator [Thermoanaerobacter mathranii subsp. mathranii str. A3]
MLRIVVPETREEIEHYIEMLEYLLENVDKTEKDKQIHEQALKELKEALKKFV